MKLITTLLLAVSIASAEAPKGFQYHWDTEYNGGMETWTLVVRHGVTARIQRLSHAKYWTMYYSLTPVVKWGNTLNLNSSDWDDACAAAKSAVRTVFALDVAAGRYGSEVVDLPSPCGNLGLLNDSDGPVINEDVSNPMLNVAPQHGPAGSWLTVPLWKGSLGGGPPRGPSNGDIVGPMLDQICYGNLPGDVDKSDCPDRVYSESGSFPEYKLPTVTPKGQSPPDLLAGVSADCVDAILKWTLRGGEKPSAACQCEAHVPSNTQSHYDWSQPYNGNCHEGPIAGEIHCPNGPTLKGFVTGGGK